MSQTTKASAPKRDLFTRYYEYQRVVSTVHLTEEGAYVEGELPEGYGGAKIDIEVCHAVFMVNSKGHLLLFEFDAPEAKDKDGKTGGPSTRDGEEFAEATGDSEVTVTQVTLTSGKLDENRLRVARAAKAAFLQAVAQASGDEKRS